MKHKNMKISITDEIHLKAVCDVLEQLGYRKWNWDNIQTGSLMTYRNRAIYTNYTNMQNDIQWETITLTDLLKMRDEMVYANIKGGKIRVRVQSGQDLRGNVDISSWGEMR